MSNKLVKAVIGAIVGVALAAAVSYGLINQQTADQIQTQANQTLSDDRSAPQQPAPGNDGAQTTAPTQPAPQNTAPTPRR